MEKRLSILKGSRRKMSSSGRLCRASHMGSVGSLVRVFVIFCHACRAKAVSSGSRWEAASDARRSRFTLPKVCGGGCCCCICAGSVDCCMYSWMSASSWFRGAGFWSVGAVSRSVTVVPESVRVMLGLICAGLGGCTSWLLRWMPRLNKYYSLLINKLRVLLYSAQTNFCRKQGVLSLQNVFST